CGNSPYKFKNIKTIEPLPSNKLAEQLKKHDIYITASKNDPCSNSLIEALHCGLPAVVLNDGGHPEITKKGGLVFNKNSEIISCFNEISNNYSSFQKNINIPTMNEVGQQYYNFMEEVFKTNKKIKSINIFKIINIYSSILFHKIIKHLK
ncbi:MAG: glycosyltransferase family 4 protein, partial [Chlorobi bacterium]|nr:glycosyltransferase family 4 protein [Chlorobiota bacterium]